MMAIRDLADERVTITLVAPDPDFVYKPLIVEEPFSSQPAEQAALAPIASEFDTEFTQQGLAEVRPDERSVKLADGSCVDYDKLVLCIGARPRPALPDAVSLRTDGTVLPIDSLLRETESSESGVIAFVIPPARTWPLPAYELALMAQRRVRELGLQHVECCVVTSEESPLIVFGRAASDAVAALLAARGIATRTGVRVKEVASGELVLYLSAFLGHQSAGELEAPPHSIDVEVALPKEWHENPMALDPFGPLP